MKKSAITKQKILDAAMILVGQHGIESTSLSMIAQAVGIKKASIYYHYDSKEILMDSVLEYILSEYKFEKYFDLVAYTKDNFVEKIIDDGCSFLLNDMTVEQDTAVQALNEFLFLGSRSSSEAKNYRLKIQNMQKTFLDGFTTLLKKGQEFDLIQEENVDKQAVILALIFDNISNYLMLGIDLDAKTIWQQAVVNALSVAVEEK